MNIACQTNSTILHMLPTPKAHQHGQYLYVQHCKYQLIKYGSPHCKPIMQSWTSLRIWESDVAYYLPTGYQNLLLWSIRSNRVRICKLKEYRFGNVEMLFLKPWWKLINNMFNCSQLMMVFAQVNSSFWAGRLQLSLVGSKLRAHISSGRNMMWILLRRNLSLC